MKRIHEQAKEDVGVYGVVENLKQSTNKRRAHSKACGQRGKQREDRASRAR